jgi:transcriptional regulator with XRE-family HTH domain
MKDSNAEVSFGVNSKARSHASCMSKSLKQAIGARVQAARRRAELSQEALASAIGRTPESISNIERGVQLPNLETLAELARALDLPLMEFFANVDVKRPPSSKERLHLESELHEVARSLSPKLLRVTLEQAKVLMKLET